MEDSNRAVSGYGIRLRWLRQELSRDLSARTASIAGDRNIVAWYLQQGYAMGLARADLEQMLANEPRLLKVARSLSDAEVSQGKPSPAFDHGDAVEVIRNAKNTTYHKGYVRSMQWHYKEQRWFYLLTDDQGRNIKKRYLVTDLRALD
jgi:hypothetical protein